MARTFSSSPGAVGDWDRNNTYYHPPSGRWYRMFRKDGVYYMRRWQKGYRGAESNVLELAVDYSVGSGTHARSFLHRSQDGRLFEMPVSWYASAGGHWAMSPGFDKPAHSDFRREVAPACLFCHSAHSALASIDCDRCHGPSAPHATSADPARIVNPSRLPAERATEVCLQCHLQTTSQPLPDSIRLKERYLPGEPLASQRLLFDHAPARGRASKFEVNSAAYRLFQSACKNLRCTDCHDPHFQKKIDVVMVCKTCHRQSAHAQSGAGCVACHMPQRAAGDAPHVTLTDHKIQRRPEPPEPAAPASYQGPVAPYFPKTVDPLWLAVAQVRDGANLEAGISQLLPFANSGNSIAVRELAEAYRKTGDFRSAAGWFRRAGDYARLGQMLLRLGDPDAAWPLLEGAAAAGPPELDTLLALGVAAGQRGDLPGSLRWFSLATTQRPEVPLSWLNLGVSLEQSGDRKRAEVAYREAIRWQPDFAPAHSHLSTLLEAAGDRGQALYEKRLASRLTK